MISLAKCVLIVKVCYLSLKPDDRLFITVSMTIYSIVVGDEKQSKFIIN